MARIEPRIFTRKGRGLNFDEVSGVACSVRDIVVGLWHRAMRPTRLRKNGIYDCQLPTWREAFESPAIPFTCANDFGIMALTSRFVPD